MPKYVLWRLDLPPQRRIVKISATKETRMAYSINEQWVAKNRGTGWVGHTFVRGLPEHHVKRLFDGIRASLSGFRGAVYVEPEWGKVILVVGFRGRELYLYIRRHLPAEEHEFQINLQDVRTLYNCRE